MVLREFHSKAQLGVPYPFPALRAAAERVARRS
jgi:hypothetical protein